MWFTNEYELINALAYAGGDFMTKTKYEQQKQELEAKEGKLYTIPELSYLIKVEQMVIRHAINVYDIPVFKLRHYKTQQNQTLIPLSGVLLLLARHTTSIGILKILRDVGFEDMTIKETLAKLDQIYKEA